jgi:hypothetical protein
MLKGMLVFPVKGFQGQISVHCVISCFHLRSWLNSSSLLLGLVWKCPTFPNMWYQSLDMP